MLRSLKALFAEAAVYPKRSGYGSGQGVRTGVRVRGLSWRHRVVIAWLLRLRFLRIEPWTIKSGYFTSGYIVMNEPFLAIWERLPLILLFGGAYLVYRMLAVNGLTEAFVRAAVVRSGGRPSRLILYIVVASAILSAFIPNAVTVLTLIPILKTLDEDFRQAGVETMTTPLMLAAIYGAGIGGMGSMIGTPANAVLLVALDLLSVPGRESVTFFNWFLWSGPLVAVFCLAAWFVAAGLGLDRKLRSGRIAMGCSAPGALTPRQRFGVKAFAVFLLFWTLEAVAGQLVEGFGRYAPYLALGFSAAYAYLIFIYRSEGRPLLRAFDMTSGVPRRGIAFLLLLAAVFAVARMTGLDGKASEWMGQGLVLSLSPWWFMFFAVLGVIFMTEILSNTVVVAGFFTVVHMAAQGQGFDPLPVMLAVSVASTCAFMTPVATPANALAFGEMRGASLGRMLLLGAVLNVIGAILMASWLGFVLPLIY